MNLQQLATIKEQVLNQQERKIRIKVGIGTCGEATGATAVLKALQREVAGRNLSFVQVETTGCLGHCNNEPLVEVDVPGQHKVVYGPVTTDQAWRLVVNHAVNGQIVSDLLLSSKS